MLGVLPFAWDAAVVWKVLGPTICAALLASSAQRVWQDVVSTSSGAGPRRSGATNDPTAGSGR